MAEMNIEPNYTPIEKNFSGVKEKEAGFGVDDTPSTNNEKSELEEKQINWTDVQDDIGKKPEDNATAGATAGDDLKDSGGNVLEDEDVKNTVTKNAGETINGATLPVPVYINSSDSEAYKTDADASGKLKFFGFAITNSTDGNSIKIQVTGVVGGFSGLTVDAIYYLSTTAGEITATAPSSLAIPVAQSISATEIVILEKPLGALGAGDNLIASANTKRGTTNTTYTKIKEVEITEAGTYRVAFDLRTDNGSDLAYGRVYKNAVAHGTENSTLSTGSGGNPNQNFSEDLDFAAGDLCQLYIKATSPSTAEADDFRIYVGARKTILVITN